MEKFKANPFNPSNKLIQSNDIINIMKKLNINDLKIKNLSLYQTAFVHKSYCKMVDYEEYTNDNNDLELQNISYETMEFLGDSILSSSVSSYLYKRYYEIYGMDEGFLTKLRTRIVCGENLAKLSSELKFNEFIIISKHIEENCSGRSNQHILEDVLEAFIGALYLDCEDYTIIRDFIFNLIEEFLDLPEIILKDTNFKDQILRYFQHNFKVYPTYHHIDKISDEGEFKCEILKETEVICIGSGKTKKKAEQNASYNALVHFNVL